MLKKSISDTWNLDQILLNLIYYISKLEILDLGICFVFEINVKNYLLIWTEGCFLNINLKKTVRSVNSSQKSKWVNISIPISFCRWVWLSDINWIYWLIFWYQFTLNQSIPNNKIRYFWSQIMNNKCSPICWIWLDKSNTKLRFTSIYI